MATNDKHCQTHTVDSSGFKKVEYGRVMYDETVVVNGKEIESPNSDEDEVRAAMSKFNPPVRHTARHDFDSSDSGSDADKFLDNLSPEEESPERKPVITDKMQLQKQTSKETEQSRPRATKRNDSSNSDTDSGDIIRSERPQRPGPERADPIAGSGRRRGAVAVPVEGAYDPKQFLDLKVPPDMENIFQYIMKYTPQKIDIEFKLCPFVPEYVPGVGDIDAFLKASTPPCDLRARSISDSLHQYIDNLGLTVVDEPAAEQSDSALLHLQLRAISKTSSAKSTVLTKKIDNAEKNTKAIDRWIKDVSELHLSKPAPTVSYTGQMPDIDNLMQEWPESMEETLNEVGFPPATLDCSLSEYVDLVCGLFDVPVKGDTLNERIQALHLLFNLYSAVKNSQLYVERQKEKDCDI